MTEIAAKPAPTTPTEGGQATPAQTKAPAANVDAGTKPEPVQDKQLKKSLVAQRAETATPSTPAGEPEAAAGAAEAKGDQKAPDEPKGPPGKYEWKAPEGRAFDTPTLTAFEESCREAGLSNENAQKILDKVAPVIAQRQLEHISAQQDAWAEQIRQDPKLGRDNLEASLDLAARGRAMLPAATQQLLEGPFGDHPAMFAGLVELGRRLSPDSQVGPGAARKPSANPEEDLLREQYPNDVV